ncbi:hypothetical protein, partial [Colwellia sp. BRX10-1]|uniref:hypothetical protein n=1 Tax=Colwellia sp. BRX10-1 TaxID=2759846 RepID=UPI001C714961
ISLIKQQIKCFVLNWLLSFNDRYKADMTSQEILKSATVNAAISVIIHFFMKSGDVIFSL